ncbi:hypothetical protein GQ53DRAFT_183924 [Thozetella sp. PMI_491]|nr:hypothetical protein GQ53DRAFT_183924 [Thozetella sp. PMI_491]
MTRLTITALLVGLASIAAVSADTPDFSGTGQILVLNSTDFAKASSNDSVGCLNVDGYVSIDDCANFTVVDVLPYTLSTSAGNCSFTDTTQATNDDSAYGSDSYAWHCRDNFTAEITDQFYTVSGFTLPFLCHGDVNCYYDIESAPTANSTSSLWEFVWGSQQMGITPGHLEVILLWQSISS